ncbi:hypothetical protein TBLA_0D05270 [Henningerozyma blattae CBS 6284]|uniref:S-formylglutathione hydrolase n=1 Tax=Henningerozyma blattae (strain ATCC 34711 / CBS 6284 / DSM 70876 / NBRC 10599 / NRRL Y-10934 / UCD 77-7) TaxID=1071380 RepID=I2H3R9_HENB6|nr:hypothetical protein TBLA_0D05270 [Tetrapisispora blattae CBS 6284]CCH61021.1 hypothetical protein TBLA_0D05270 [Tetrapisispora blattae CBS 6284]
MEETHRVNCAQGILISLAHDSKVNNCRMVLNVYLPKQYYAPNAAEKTKEKPIPTIYFLDGLSADQNHAPETSFIQWQADIYGFAVVFPDTSPRGEEVPDFKDIFELGQSGGYYINASKEPFAKYYNMFDYVHKEMPNELTTYFNKISPVRVDFLENVSIIGHSMGGMGSLMGYLKTFPHYKSCSAIAPLTNPTSEDSKAGHMGLHTYLKNPEVEGFEWDPCYLIKDKKFTEENVKGHSILVTQGTTDPIIETELHSDRLVEYAKGTPWQGKIIYQFMEGFDHGSYLIATEIPNHAKYHAKRLGLTE